MQCSVPDPQRGWGPWGEPRQLQRLAQFLFQCMLWPLEGSWSMGEQLGPLKALPLASMGPGHLCLWSAPCSPEGPPGRGWQVESPRRGPSLGTRSRVPVGAQAVVRAGATAVAQLTRSSTGRFGCEGVKAEVG